MAEPSDDHTTASSPARIRETRTCKRCGDEMMFAREIGAEPLIFNVCAYCAARAFRSGEARDRESRRA